MTTEPCKILDGTWRCCNCKMPRATRWGHIKFKNSLPKEGWWCQTCIDALLGVDSPPRAAGTTRSLDEDP